MPLNKIQGLKPTIYIPVALQKRLKSIKNYPLIVLQAASGFGKTTVISEYLHQSYAHQVCWYTCMGEPLRKAWKGICKTFSQIDQHAAKQLETLEYPTQENLVDIVDIMRGCEVNGDTWLILDNFQYIQGELPERMLHALSCHGCSGLHIVVITQTVDSIDMVGIPAEQVMLVQNETFFFQKEDTDAYFRANEIALSKDELDKLQMLSEGWAAALNLQLIRYLREGDFEVSDSMDALIRAVIWNRLEADDQQFLMAVSLLQRFTVKQAHVFLEKKTLPAGILRLLGSGSFLHYERENGSYTLHSLLQSFLKQELKGLPSNVIRNMQKLAADAYAVAGERYYALCGYLEVGELEALLSLPLKAEDFSLYLEAGSAAVLERVFIECDSSILLRYPQTLCMIIFELFRLGNYASFEKGCLLINELISNPEKNALNDEDTRVLIGQLAFLESFTAFNDIEKMSALHRKAWEVLGGPYSNREDWNDSWSFGQPSVLYLFWSASGALDKELDCMDECLPYYVRLTEGHGSGADCAMRAETLLMRGDDTVAEVLCHKAIYVADNQKQDSICIAAEMTLLRIALLRGDAEGFENIKNSILKRRKNGTEPAVKKMADLALSFVSVLAGETAIPEWLTDLNKITRILYDVAIPFGVLTYLRWLLYQGHNAKLLGIAQGALPAVEQHHFILPQVYFHLFMAIAYHRLEQPKEAEAALECALSLALPDDIYLPFAEYDEMLAPLLKLQEKKSHIPKLTALCTRHRLGVDKIRKATLYGQLTPREREVAHLAAGELTNRDIASRLLISQETVKSTMKSIFHKLGMRSRVQLQELKNSGKI
ncbi:LuxR C-terminal-related transcriptional regulator [Anoxynatronum buryatiense]|uniref:LuxR family transcriptional regulator, maltose regulon positive regulatory protein n=1 Tax=Anoxynatronum buryatiense TaxID=489973 RepID=A0AA46AK21_9CLOT|nr:LuxR C-terminal-related transcriptional regulator [Anoxynatronum buryatiense]SMP66575.1 LuxR family transcriptional regulator, maltose regulon positive regulatory protein [Anoxynatronum buryatiense]